MGVRNMFIQTQPTPNPDSLKFLPGCEVLGDEFGMVSMDFTAGSENSARSELARKLLAIKSVTRVFFAHDFISITKDDATPWEELKPHVFACIMDFFGTGKPIIEAASEEGAIDPNAVTDDDDEIVVLIKELLETRIRPAVQEDGGDILFHRFEPDTGLVLLQLAGSCAGCPSSSVTLKSGVENMLMHYIPEVEGVVAVDEAQARAVAGLTREYGR